MSLGAQTITAYPDWPTKINVGCGYDKRPGHLNVDMDPACEPDLLIAHNDFTVLPREHFETLVSYDVLEHIPRSETMNALLEWADLIRPGGMLELQTSNVVAIAEMMKATRSYERHSVYTIFMYGNQLHPGDFHLTGFTDITLSVFLAAAGFEVLEMYEDEIWLYTCTARKIAGWADLLKADLSDHDFVQAAYRQALQRDPEDAFLEIELEAARTDRRGLLKKLFASDERCLRTAGSLGY